MESVLVLGGSGLVGSRLVQLWRGHFQLSAPSHADLDVLDFAMLGAFLEHARPHAVVNLAAWADVDAAEAQRDDVHGRAYQLNVTFAGQLARLCREIDTYLLHVSTDYVFDGDNDRRPYREDDATNPLSWYAQTKELGEQAIRNENANACIARIEMPFSAHKHPKGDFSRLTLTRLQRRESVSGVVDQRITPVFLDDAVAALRRLVELGATGTVHVAATTWTSPYEMARGIAARLGLDAELVQPTVFEEFAGRRPARRPRHSWLDVGKTGALIGHGVLRSTDDQLDAWAAQAREATQTTELVR